VSAGERARDERMISHRVHKVAEGCFVVELNQISSKIIKAAITVHNELGPGLLESVYRDCMEIELKELGLKVFCEVPLPIVYKGRNITDNGFRLDLLVEDTVIVELKSVEAVQPVHKKQLLTYLRLANKPLGLLINFNQTLIRNGITRIINSTPGNTGAGKR
jgi:GxxExxY protein